MDAGGTACNVVPDHAKLTYGVRALKLEDVDEIIERIKKVAQGAAMMTETRVEVHPSLFGYSDYFQNAAVCGIAAEAMAEVGAPAWSAEDLAKAAEYHAFFDDRTNSNPEKIVHNRYPQEQWAARISQPLMVRLLDKVRLQWLILTGMVLMAGTTVLTALANSVWLLNLIGVVRGIGIGCCYLPVVTTVLGNWFFKSYGLISGITLSFSGLSGAILSQVLTGMLSRYGMRSTLLMAAAGIIVLLLPALLFVRAHPEEAGVRPYGEKEASTGVSEDAISPALPMKSGTVLFAIALPERCPRCCSPSPST